jgi:hypothetical protein
MAQTQNTGVSQKRRVFLRVWERDEYDPEDDGRTHYYAKAGRLVIEGWLYYADREDVKVVLGRILEAGEPLPDVVAKAVDSVVNHLVTVVQLGSTTAAAHAGFDREGDGLSFTVEMFYDDANGGWVMDVRAVRMRHDGRHILSKRVKFIQVTAEALRKAVEKVVRQAYNA